VTCPISSPVVNRLPDVEWVSLLFSDEAIRKLNEETYDAVFLDLILEGDSTQDAVASGNTVLEHIISNNRIRLIVYVVSSTLNSLSDQFEGAFENPLMRKFDREKDTAELIADLVKVFNTGVTKILGGSGKLESLINDIFFKHLAKGFELWPSDEKNREKELLRYTTLHLLEYLDLPEKGQNGESNYLNPEFYIYPPIKEAVATGDIVEYQGAKYALLSPSCDIAPRQRGEETVYNVEVVALAQILPLEKETFDSMRISYSGKGKTNQGAWDDFVVNQKSSSPKNRYHYIPAYLEISESLIDFKRIISIPLKVILDKSQSKRLATVSLPFVRDIQSRFSAYYGRQGQPTGEWSG
jgi:hypothetical protein